MFFTSYLIFLEIRDGLGEGYGMLGQAGSGKLRVLVGQSKLAGKEVCFLLSFCYPEKLTLVEH